MLNKLMMIMAFLCFVPMVAQAAVDPAMRGKQAENKVLKLGDDVIAALESTVGSDADRKKSFTKILNKNFDMKAIARFSMGRYWAIATADEKKTYTKLFRKMVVKVYSNRFSEYSGQKFEVLGNKPAGRKDIVVNSKIIGAKGRPVKVDWRVRKNRIIDVVVEGVSMSVTQRSEFASIIQRGGGKVAALITHLEK